MELPFGIFVYQDSGVKISGKINLYGYGFVCIAESGRTFKIELSDMVVLPEEKTQNAEEGAFLVLEGEDSVLWPKIGESQSRYRAVLFNMLGDGQETAATFRIKTEASGAQMGKNGLLTVNSGLSQEEIIIEAVTADGRSCEKTIKLFRSWTNNQNTENGYDASLASAQEIAPIIDSEEILRQTAVLFCIRSAAIVGCAVLIGYYLFLRKKNRRKQ